MGNEGSKPGAPSRGHKFPGKGHSLQPAPAPAPAPPQQQSQPSSTSSTTKASSTPRTNAPIKPPTTTTTSSSAAAAVSEATSPRTPVDAVFAALTLEASATRSLTEEETAHASADMDELIAFCGSTEQSVIAMQTIQKLAVAIINEPTNPKFRRIRTSNPAFVARVGSSETASAFLISAGFVPIQENEETVLIFPEEAPIELLKLARKKLELAIMQANASLSATSTSTSAAASFPPSSGTSTPQPAAAGGGGGAGGDDTPTPRKQINREPLVLKPSTKNIDPSKFWVSEDFYDMTADDMKELLSMQAQKTKQKEILMTRAMREKARGPKPIYTKCLIRIRFPDGYILQGTFLPRERPSALYKFVRENLVWSERPFELVTQPPKQKIAERSTETLTSLDLLPATLINLWWLDQEGDVRESLLLPELLSRASEVGQNDRFATTD